VIESVDYARVLTFIEVIATVGLSSTLARAAAGRQSPLTALRHLYLDTSATLVTISLLGSSGALQLGLPGLGGLRPFADLPGRVIVLAIALLLLGVIVARHSWRQPNHAKRADAAMNAVSILVVVGVALISGQKEASGRRLLDVGRQLVAKECSQNGVLGSDATAAALALLGALQRGGENSADGHWLAANGAFDEARGDRFVLRERRRRVQAAASREKEPETAAGESFVGETELCAALRVYLALRGDDSPGSSLR
jgi:hypothetical protein